MATVLITGTNRGIGLEFVKQFLAREDTVLATCRDMGSATELRQLKNDTRKLHIFELDVSSQKSMEDLTLQLAGHAIDIFINNAGVYGPRDSTFGKVSANEWAKVLQVNAKAPMILTQLLIDNLRDGSDKKLLYITSKMGSIDDNKGGGSYVYRSSKAALNAVVKSISVDLRDSGFSVAVLHPGWVQTDMGGPNALIDVTTSVSKMIDVIDNLNFHNSGSFFNYDGGIIPW
ncbi:MAG: SDR family oxidoreductase [Gammaproteobacteria bacterium]|nr:SDR family oxidoreductase [Pseudomonadales bacterium]MCS5579474.1 SDR family oxidoreductase [Gammaproteobacteria bacterium]HAD72538.1 short-chain dehydrogenase [Gammaproteobacteria bacterium]|tara:strand:- start:22071 stop:22763 length:693 start_codon:yes stop_codon:yes gene_type:complete